MKFYCEFNTRVNEYLENLKQKKCPSFTTLTPKTFVFWYILFLVSSFSIEFLESIFRFLDFIRYLELKKIIENIHKNTAPIVPKLRINNH